MDYPIPMTLNEGNSRDPQGSNLCIALAHFSYESPSPLRSLLVLSQFYLAQFNRIHIITSDIDQETLKTLQPHLKEPRIKVSYLDEAYLVDCLQKMREESGESEGLEEGSTLVLFNDTPFCTSTIDLLIPEVDQLLLITNDSIEGSMESYQVFKAHQMIAPELRVTLFLLGEKESQAVPVIKSDLPLLFKKYLKVEPKIYELYPGELLDQSFSQVIDSDCFKLSKMHLMSGFKEDQGRRNYLVYDQLLLA